MIDVEKEIKENEEKLTKVITEMQILQQRLIELQKEAIRLEGILKFLREKENENNTNHTKPIKENASLQRNTKHSDNSNRT
jgi:predicted RNase H-like nuclease (RuvC/YqgF family)